MKLFILSLFTMFSLSAHASSERDSLLGLYRGMQPDGRSCYLLLQNVAGKTDLEFTDSMSSRSLKNIGAELEAQLARRAPVLVFKKKRSSLGSATIYLEIQRSSTGLPIAMRGTVAGWLHADINCSQMRR